VFETGGAENFRTLNLYISKISEVKSNAKENFINLQKLKNLKT
jgi:hypothetical protein